MVPYPENAEAIYSGQRRFHRQRRILLISLLERYNLIKEIVYELEDVS